MIVRKISYLLIAPIVDTFSEIANASRNNSSVLHSVQCSAVHKVCVPLSYLLIVSRFLKFQIDHRLQ